MRQFKDNDGRIWQIVIHTQAVRNVRNVLKIDMVKLIGDGAKGLSDLVSDPVQLVDILWLLCRGQNPTVSDEQFGVAMGGDALGDATNAFLEELADFFPEKKAREAFKELLSKSRELGSLVLDRAMREVKDIDMAAEVGRMDLATLAEKLTPSSTSVPASSASIPVPSL